MNKNVDYKLVKIISRQTNYNEETIIKKLEEHNNNIENIILEYNGVVRRNKDEDLSTNQKIFKAIRENF